MGGLVGALSAAIFAPYLKKFGDQYEAHTLADFFGVRYSSTSQTLGAIYITLVYLIITGAQYVGLAALLQVWTGASFSAMVWVAAISTIIYTAFAGIKSDFYTDIVHFIVMFIVMALVLVPITVSDLGGLSALGSLPESYFDPFAYGGIPFFAAGLIFGAASVFVTMEIWQRIYASASESTAQRALVFGIFGILVFYGISTFLGMSAQIVVPNLADRDQALFVLMMRYLPTGLLGLGMAGFIAVFVSTINSTLMVASASLTKDLYKGWWKPSADDSELLTTARVVTAVYGLASLLLAVVLQDVVILSVNGLFMLLILFPSVIGGFFWEEATAAASNWSIIAGLVGLVAFWFVDPTTAFVPGFIVSGITFVLVSKITTHSDQESTAVTRLMKKEMF
jgi:SSS family solute:Na+ symporter